MLTATLPLSLLLLLPPAGQDGPPPVPAPDVRPAQGHEDEDPAFAELFGRYRAAVDAHTNHVRELRRQGTAVDRLPAFPVDEWIPRFLEIADAGSARAYVWLLDQLPGPAAATEEQRQLGAHSVRRLLEAHGDTDHALRALESLGRRNRFVSEEEALELLEAVADRTSNPEVAARAFFEMASIVSEGFLTEDPALRERSDELLRVVVDGYAGTRAAVFAAERFFSRRRMQFWQDLEDWAQNAKRLHAEGTPLGELPAEPVAAAHLDFVVLAQAGHPLAIQWTSMLHPGYEQAARRSRPHGWFELSQIFIRTLNPGIERAMAARFAILELLIAALPDDPIMHDVLETLSADVPYFDPDVLAPRIEELARLTTDDEIRYQALYVLARSLQRSNREQQILRAAELYARVMDEAPTSRHRRQAELTLRELQRFLPGAVAPDFTTPDNDFFTIQLSDYRGRVVLLAFWGFWHPEVEELLAGLRAIDERFEGRPFALLGMNTDGRDPRRFTAELAERGIRFRHSRQLTRSGPVARLFEVSIYPFLILIDADGIQQGRGLSLEGLAERIEQHVLRAEEQAAANR